MGNQRTAPSATRPLWIIAFLLAAIAACLVMLVIHQSRRAPVESNTESVAQVSSPVIAPVHQNVPMAARKSKPTESVAVPDAPIAPPEVVASPETTVAVPQVVTERSSGFANPTGPLVSSEQVHTNWNTFIIGHVSLIGKPQPETRITFDSACGRLNSAPVTTQRYVVSGNGGLKDVVVYISGGLDNTKYPAPSEPAVLTVAQCQFQPYVLPLMVKQQLLITNSDPVWQGFLGFGLDTGTTLFNERAQPRTQIGKRFETSEIPLRIKSTTQPAVISYVFVLENPFYAVTDRSGNFTITNPPPGDYTITAFHPKTHLTTKGISKSITVVPNGMTMADFKVELSGKTIAGLTSER